MSLNKFLSSETGSVKVEVVNPVLNVSDTITQASLTSIDTKTRLGTYGHQVDVRKGTLPGGTNSLTGQVEDIDAGQIRTIATGLILSERIEFDKTRVGVALRVSSTDAADTSPSGTGATVVQVTGVIAGGDEKSFIAIMAGNAAATLLELDFFTPFTDNVIACNQIAIINVGSSEANVGTIYCGPSGATWTTGKPNTIYCLAGPTTNISRQAAVYIPNAEDHFQCDWFITTTASSGQDVELVGAVSVEVGGTNIRFEGNRLYAGEGAHAIRVDCRSRWNPGDFVEFSAQNHNGNNIDVSIQIGVIIVPI